MQQSNRRIYSIPAAQVACRIPGPSPGKRRRLIYVVRGRPGPLDRPPLPSGHPESWALITDDTILHGSAYAIPMPPRGREC